MCSAATRSRASHRLLSTAGTPTPCLQVEWGSLGVQVALECSGKFLNREKLQPFFDKVPAACWALLLLPAHCCCVWPPLLLRVAAHVAAQLPGRPAAGGLLPRPARLHATHDACQPSHLRHLACHIAPAACRLP